MSLFSFAQQAESEKPVTRSVYFLELTFAGGVSRISTYDRDYPWGGYTWFGFGQVLNLSNISESEGTVPNPLRVTLAAQTSWIAVAVGPVEEYRGKPAKMYCCPLGEDFLLTGTPVLAWTGIIDMALLNVDGDQGTVEIKCETMAYALKRRSVSRINAAQHKSRYPTETGLDYQADLIANPQVWLSKRFLAQ